MIKLSNKPKATFKVKVTAAIVGAISTIIISLMIFTSSNPDNINFTTNDSKESILVVNDKQYVPYSLHLKKTTFSVKEEVKRFIQDRYGVELLNRENKYYYKNDDLIIAFDVLEHENTNELRICVRDNKTESLMDELQFLLDFQKTYYLVAEQELKTQHPNNELKIMERKMDGYDEQIEKLTQMLKEIEENGYSKLNTNSLSTDDIIFRIQTTQNRMMKTMIAYNQMNIDQSELAIVE